MGVVGNKPSIAHLGALSLFSLLLLRYLLRRISIHRFITRTGCKFPRTAPGGFLGLKLAKETDVALENGEYLALARSRFATIGTTYQGSVMGMPYLATIEPENLKAIFTRIEDFTKSGRKVDWWPMLQGGILIADGQEWKHSRVGYP
jgi:hypothetical protein